LTPRTSPTHIEDIAVMRMTASIQEMGGKDEDETRQVNIGLYDT
jgi:hypothetical protein